MTHRLSASLEQRHRSKRCNEGAGKKERQLQLPKSTSQSSHPWLLRCKFESLGHGHAKSSLLLIICFEELIKATSKLENSPLRNSIGAAKQLEV